MPMSWVVAFVLGFYMAGFATCVLRALYWL